MQAANALVAVVIATAAVVSTGAEAGRVRVSQEMTRGAQDFTVKGFVETFRSEMTAAQVYDYGGRCPSSYAATVFLPEPNATVMAVVDTAEGRTLFTVHHFPTECLGGSAESDGGSASMSFVSQFDEGPGIGCLVRDDPTEDVVLCDGDKVSTAHSWLPQFTDGFAFGPLEGPWRLDASFFSAPRGVSQVIVRSSGAADVTGLATDKTIRLDNALEVDIDVQPGSELGCLAIVGNGVIPVAILGGPDLDVGEIDTGGLDFAGMQLRVRGNGKPQCAIEHINDDGHPDLACHFFDDPDAWTPGNATAAVSGELLDSTPIYGEDSICVRPPA